MVADYFNSIYTWISRKNVVKNAADKEGLAIRKNVKAVKYPT